VKTLEINHYKIVDSLKAQISPNDSPSHDDEEIFADVKHKVNT